MSYSFLCIQWNLSVYSGHTLAGASWLLLKGDHFKQVVLYRINTTRTTNTDHNREAIVFKINNYRQVALHSKLQVHHILCFVV